MWIYRVLKSLHRISLGDAAQKRKVRHQCARIAASLFGDYPISDDYKVWREDREFLADHKRLSRSNPCSEDRKYLLREFARFTRHLTGAMAECGCYQGASAYFLAKEDPGVKLYLFDSFEGLSKPTVADSHGRDDNFSWKAGDLSASEEHVLNNLRDFANVMIYKGWIPTRFDEVADQMFRLAHIDLDLYQPILDSLTFFYDRVQPGGVIVLDDYGFTTCPGAHKAVAEFMSDKPEYVLHVPTGQGVIIKSGANDGK